jgi:hypothetical protein
LCNSPSLTCPVIAPLARFLLRTPVLVPPTRDLPLPCSPLVNAHSLCSWLCSFRLALTSRHGADAKMANGHYRRSPLRVVPQRLTITSPHTTNASQRKQRHRRLTFEIFSYFTLLSSPLIARCSPLLLLQSLIRFAVL